MIFVPLKWIPYLLLLASLYGIFGEGDWGWIVGVIISAVWIYLRSSEKSTSTTEAGAQSASGTLSQKQEALCLQCGAENASGSVYCEKCGNRLAN
ncbi:MAG TPA: zinc ribbon domain-containing protein [Candidatus Pullichristensenella excrementigallinarum]|uniref:Zinc ribbon domain-containing protein n=1 Tax=Candidatus Pullichristensenella excrementigallinarum TaxID=2840907 RepID=A0A9D1ID40_9FIRM|nr:zinc ribbon domain-containing protein [Candidatus Pullichristensenella excrementigallinarum]